VGGAGVSFAGNVLTYDSGDAALGAFGVEVPVTLIVADTLGHSLSHSFTFTLEVEPVVVANLYVFGSPEVQRAGQKLPNSPTSQRARQEDGPVPAGGADEWEITGMGTDTVTITYTGDTCPIFEVGFYLANRTPAKVSEIFYRKITDVTDTPASKTLVLATVDVPFAEIVTEGSISFSQESVIYEVGEDGGVQEALEFSTSITFDPFGVNRDGSGPYPLGEFSLTLPEAHLLFTPTLDLAIETSFGIVVQASVKARVDVEAALVAKITYELGGFSEATSIPLHSPIKKLVSLGALGPVPVWADLTYTTDLTVEASGDSALEFQTGWRRNFSYSAEASYTEDADPEMEWETSATDSGNRWQPVVVSASGMVSARAAIVPNLDVKLMSLAGFYVNVDPGYGAEVTATGSLSFTPGVPGGFEVGPLESFTIEGEACAVGVEPISYQWYQNGRLLPLQDGPRLSVASFRSGMAGDYVLKATQGGVIVSSPIFTVSELSILEGFELIPAGSFQMGDATGVGYDNERPVHTVNVSAFYMGKYEVTKELWDSVRAWGLNNGYTDLAVGASKGANHPVHSISWYDIVKWCNSRSEKDGAIPCYTVGEATYKAGERNDVVCNWAASGYRLPTEAEWEKAARGGLSGKYFPWGDTISHSRANFYNGGSEDYETGTTGFHPTWSHNDDGNWPYSSPVGIFAPNGYGLYDMAGNMCEWCWDRFGSYGAGAQTDPRGASAGSSRVYRGGSWYSGALICRAANRYDFLPDGRGDDFGFRLARSSVPQ
jgi:sulfatase modifying factor 1